MGHKSAGQTTGAGSQPQTNPPVKRRGLMFGLGAAGAAVLAVKLVPGAQPVAAALPAARPASGDAPEGGYRLSAHVKRYYETTRS